MWYEKNQHSKSKNFRNGGIDKIKSSFGKFNIQISRDRQTTFEPKIVPKRQRDISKIEWRIIKIYSISCFTRIIIETIKDIYCFGLNPTYISKITDTVLPNIEEQKSKSLKRIYPFMFIDGIWYKI